MKASMKKRILAMAIALLMVLQILPASLLAVKAADETVTHSFDATKDVSPVADKEAIEEGTTYTDGFFKVVGKVTQRTNGDATKVKSIELDKKSNGGIEFTITGTATVTIGASSTGGSNTSVIDILKSDGTAIGEEEVTGTSSTEVTYENLEPGTYKIVNPGSDRNTRVITITVTETTTGSGAGGDNTEEPATSWDFRLEEYTGQNSYNGLALTGSISKHGAQYGMAIANGKISVPVSGPCEIQVSVGYNWDVTFPDGTQYKDNTNSGDITVSYIHTGEAGTVEIVVGNEFTSYIKSIELKDAPVVEEPATSWDFRLEEYTGQNSYNGLALTGSFAKHDATYGIRMTGGTIAVPVSGSCSITVTVGYNWDITFPDGSRFTHDSSDPVVYNYTGEAGTVQITVGDSYTSYIAMIELGNAKEEPQETEPAATEPAATEPSEGFEYEAGKIYVWDFAAEQLTGDGIVNMLTVDEINSWFPGVEPGTTGKNLASFTTADGLLSFNDGGYPTTHRLRTKNEALTRYDGKDMKDADGNVYSGYIYSNKGSATEVYISIQVTAGDIITVVAGSNGNNSLINFEAPSGKVAQQEFLSSGAKAQLLTFHATENGTYKIYSTTEKLVVARIYLAHNAEVTVTGNVTAPEALTGYKLLFTCKENGATTEATVENGAYSVTLLDNHSYEVSLVDANGYVITVGDALTIEKGATAPKQDITILAVDLVTITGNITGLDADILAKLELTLESDGVYIPEVVITGNTYSVKLEKGRDYSVIVKGINDFALSSAATVKYDADGSADIAFQAKPTYKITIVPEGCKAEDLAGATFTFTNLNEEGYVYTFTGTDSIVLRNGTYSVKVTNIGKYVQRLTANLVVNGADVSKNIGFEVPSSWDFTSDDYASQNPYNGISFEGSAKKHGASYGMTANSATISIPVEGPCVVTVYVGYTWDITFPDGTKEAMTEGDNGKNVPLVYNHTGGAGTVNITVGSTATYISKIQLTPLVLYKETLTVGASGCDYTTIGAALEAVRAMERTENQRVTILIQPGNYEEMLVVDVPNVTLKNASENPSTALKDQGVNIDANAVRITWYYGHGYHYFSMGSDYKFSADVLAVNKANGVHSTDNPGSGTQTYWNASVVISADGFRAEGIIFENSFNQYISEAAANDILVKTGSAKEGATLRTDMVAGSTLVQDKKYVERAAALAIADGTKEAYFENCKFIGRQDTLYGGHKATAAFYDCAIYGSTDYIFGGMTAVFAKCDLVFNTSEDKNDVGYITAAQTKEGHGFLMYNCTITSTTPGVDTASQYTSKPGYFGRPWQATTGEAVFYNTVIDATCTNFYSISPSLIRADGWLSTLSGESGLCGEYGTYEYAKDVNNSSNRVNWAAVFAEAKLASGEPISIETWLGSWDAFAGKDLTIVIPTEKVDNAEKPTEPEGTEPEGTVPGGETSSTHILDTTKDLQAMDKGAKADGDTLKLHDFFTIIFSSKTKIDESGKTFEDGYTASQRLNFGGKTDPKKDMINSVMFTTSGPVTVKIWWVSGGADRYFAIMNADQQEVAKSEVPTASNVLYISTLTVAEAGTYYLAVPAGNNYLFKLEVSDGIEETPPVTEPEESEPTTTEPEATEPEATEPKPTDPVVTEPKPTDPVVTEPKPTDPVVTEPKPTDPNVNYVEKTFSLDVTKDIKPFISGAKAEGEVITIGEFFNIICGEKTKVDSSSKVFSDGYAASFRLNFQAATDDKMNCTVKFTTEGAATIKIWWVSGGDGRSFAIYNEQGQIVTRTTETSVKNSLYISTLELDAAGTYYLGVPEGNNLLFRMDVTTLVAEESDGTEEPEVTEPKPTETEPEEDKTILDISKDLPTFEVGSKADGETMIIGNFFTLHLSAKSKVEGKVKSFPDGYIGTQRFSLGGKTEVENGMLNSVEFTAEGPTTLKIWWVGGGEGRYIAIYDAAGNIVLSSELCEEKDDLHITELTLTAGGKYYIGMPEGNNYLFRIEASEAEITEPDATEPEATEPEATEPAGSPETGDSSMISLAVALLVMSCTAIVILPKKKNF